MIANVKKVKDVGVFKDYETKKTGLQKDFGKKNFIYGLNTYGKSTLCDIFKDVSDDATDRIQKRLTIPNGTNQDIVINLSDGAGTVKLNGSSWCNNKLKSKLMVFDTEFMINNVFNGTNLIEDRTTKENFTEFILGDKGVALAQEIEELKREIKDEKAKLQGMVPYSQKGESDATIKKYVKQCVEEKIEDLEETKEELSKQIKKNRQRENNRADIKKYKVIEAPDCSKLTKLIKEVEAVRNILETNYSMTADTLVTFEKHIKEACHGLKGAQEWIGQGIHFMADDNVCPFCGQEIADKSLVNAFSECLCEEYQIFRKNLQQRINSVSIDWNVFTLSKDVVDLQKMIKKAEEIFGESVSVWDEELEKIYQEIVLMEKEVQTEFNNFRDKVKSLLKSKSVLCNVKVELDVDIIEKIKKNYDKKIEDISKIVNNINEVIFQVKNDINSSSYEEENDKYMNQLRVVEEKITRLKENDDCEQWKLQFNLIEEKNCKVKEKSKALEENQKEYLDNYFNVIDTIFKRYGGHKFKIERGDFNNKGYKKIFGVNISFNNVLISESGMTGTVFSESDKRALALAVFMAKLECIPRDEKEKIILVLDDPVTSFDDNRMKIIINSLINVSDEVEQTFILSHHFMFSKMLSDRYFEHFNFYKLAHMDGNSNGIFDMDAKEEFLTGFDKEYLNISKFNNAETDSMSENELRVFLEEYLKTIFAKQYDEYKLTSKQLGERIDELERIGVITSDVKTKLHYYRNELNSGSHTFQMNTIDDDRNFSIDFVHYLFDNVHMG